MSELAALAAQLRGHRLFLLGGAGVSTPSGIPDYRSPERLARPRSPIQGPDFVRSAAVRQRYWARSFVGWPLMSQAQPNAAHRAIAALGARSVGLVTQNVDGLHHAAGSPSVIELHGALRRVRCLDCGALTPRDALQSQLAALNPALLASGTAAPDGDADLPDELIAHVQVPACSCGGVLKPDVVFFGDNVPAERVDEAWRWFDAATGVLVLGSSLTVFSGFRFVKRAAAEGKPVWILNRGPTRGDALAAAKVEAPLEAAVPELVGLL